MRKTKTSLLVAVLSAVWTATTLAAAVYTTVRVTNEAGCSRAPSSNGSGKIIAFDSAADLVPDGNADGNYEIFLRDQKKGITQITDTTGGTSGSGSAAINKAGSRIAFTSDRDLVPGGNADANSEIFLFDKKKGFAQITTTTGGGNSEPAVSASGAIVVFASDRDLIPGLNDDGSTEIFLFDLKKGLKQITSSSTSSTTPAVSNSAARIAFVSSADLVSGSNADLSSEIFLFDKKKGLIQITDGTSCSSQTPAINAGGTRIAFVSTCDLVAGSNPGTRQQVFLYDVKKGFIQITLSTSDGTEFEYPAINANGKRIAFVSNGDLVPPGNVDLNYEAFLFIEKKGFVQLSHTTGGKPGVSSGPSLSSGGKRIAVELNGEEVTDGNADDEGEIYVVEEK